MPIPAPNLPDEAEDQEVEDLVIEVPEDDIPADEQEGHDPGPQEPKDPVEPKKAPPPAAEPEPEAKPPGEDDDDDASLSEKVRKRINKMTYKQRKAEREAQEYRQRYEALERERETERQQYETRVGQSDDLIIASREEAIKAEVGRANQDYINAYRSGDEAQLIAAQNKLVELQVSQQELLRVKQRREAMKGERPQPQPQYQQPQAPQQQPQDREFVELQGKAAQLADDYISQYQEWWDKDEVLTGSVLSIDKRLKAEGLKPWEPSFYEELDKRLRRRFPSEFGASEPAAPAASAPAQRPSQPVAGVSRGPAKGSVSVRLTPEDKAYCERNGIPPEAFARELHALERSKK